MLQAPPGVECQRHQAANHHANNHVRQPWRPALDQHARQQSAQGNCSDKRVDVVELLNQALQNSQRRRAPCNLQAKKFLTWLSAISTAAPAVKPTTTVCDTKLTSVPKRSRPNSN